MDRSGSQNTQQACSLFAYTLKMGLEMNFSSACRGLFLQFVVYRIDWVNSTHC